MSRKPTLSALAILLALAWTAPILAQQEKDLQKARKQAAERRKKRNQQKEAQYQKWYATLDPLEPVSSVRLSDTPTYDHQPSIAQAKDGTVWVAWVRYHNKKADEVVVLSRKDSTFEGPVTLTPEQGQYIRPVLAAYGDDVWCFWTVTQETVRSSIHFSRRTGDAWSSPEPLLPGEALAHQNPEVAVSADGRIAVAYQIHNGSGYDIHLKLWDGEKWGAARPVSDKETNDWDPALAFDKEGHLHAVWTGFFDGDYDIYWVHPLQGRPRENKPRRISARGEYDLSPWIAAGPDNSVWVSWDVVFIPDHGFSGKTTITGANLRTIMDDDKTEGHLRLTNYSAIEVRVITGNTVRIPGNPRKECNATLGYRLAHRGMSKVAIGPKGDPWLFYRALRFQKSPGIGYFWEVHARPFRDGAWQAPVRMEESDSYLEEPSLVSGPQGIHVAYSSEHRITAIPPGGARGPVDPAKPDPNNWLSVRYDHHRDFDSRRGWKGDIYLGLVKFVPGEKVKSREFPEEKAPPDRPVPGRKARELARHKVEAKGKTYRLLWGDTHIHTNISRCSAGQEPSPEDRYRYGMDISQYDFVALADHSEDPRYVVIDAIDYYWWYQQKIADLWHVPGVHSVLYNYEWSLSYPHGHHNTIFPGRPTVRLDRYLTYSCSLLTGWDYLADKKMKAITIPHTGADPGMGTSWEVQDDRYQRLCEIFQACRGSYEHEGCPREYSITGNTKGFYWRALEKGYHVGVIASSDHGYGTAYACVYAPENTRESIWQAMWDRRTYGSTTYGLVLEMRSGDRWMGEEWKSKEAPKLGVFTRGGVPIRSVEILGRSKVLFSQGSIENPIDKNEVRLSWSDPDWDKQDNEQWYYVRVIQTDDEIAWSSPVWVTPEK